MRHTLYKINCTSDIKIINPSRTRNVVANEEVCDGFGGSNVIKIELSGRDSSRRPILLVYEPVYEPENFSHAPVATWVSNTELEIYIDRIGHVYTQRAQVDGIRVAYRFGKIIYP